MSRDSPPARRAPVRAGPASAGDLPPDVLTLVERARELMNAAPDARLTPLAVELCLRALARAPGHPLVVRRLVRALHVNGRSVEAAAACDDGLAVHPEAVELELERLLVTFPLAYRDEGEVESSRRLYEERLAALERRLTSAGRDELARLGHGSSHIYPYLLPYQACNDAELQRRLGPLLREAVLAAHPGLDAQPALAAPGEPLRVGFVSDQIRNHTVWHAITRGWLSGLRARGWTCFGYSVGAWDDDCTEASRADCSRFVAGDLTVAQWAREIGRDRPHVLIYPALGYSGTVDRLALTRLGPVQCTTFGHCETSGYPTMDLFLGSTLMEPDDGEAHYTEHLVRLPDLGLSYPAARVEPGARGRDLPGLRAGAVLFLSPHLPKKYLPRHDELYGRIAEAVPDAQLVFFRDPRSVRITRVLEGRLRAALVARGLDPERQLVFLDRLAAPDYQALLAAADVYLDVPGWNGGTTTAEALVRGVPVVTLEGTLARGRMGSAMLRHVGVTNGLALTPDGYVREAAELGRDAALRADVRRRLAAAGGRISDDAARVDGLAALLEGAVSSAAAPA